MVQSDSSIKQNRFIALLPSHESQDRIFTILKPYKKRIETLAHTKWVFPTDYHITIGYMKSVHEDDISALQHAMRSSLSLISSFHVKCQRVQFLGRALTLVLEPNEIFQAIYQTLFQAVERMTQDKYPFETRGYFLPHLTLAKIDRNDAHDIETRESIEELVSEPCERLEFYTERLCLMQSKNSDITEKSRYEILLEYELNPAQHAG